MRPTRLTPEEVENMRTLAESGEHRDMSLRALALHAQRIGKVVASPSSDCSMEREPTCMLRSTTTRHGSFHGVSRIASAVEERVGYCTTLHVSSEAGPSGQRS